MSSLIHIKSLKSTRKENQVFIRIYKNWLIALGCFLYSAVCVFTIVNKYTRAVFLLGIYSVPYLILFVKVYKKKKVNKKITKKIHSLKKNRNS